MVKISIIIPIYNTEKFLQRCLDSLRVQTLKEIEIICVNDGSTDNSSQIIDSFSTTDNRFIKLDQVNSGPAAARNLGLKMAKGEFIMFCDSDDWYEPNMCQIMYDAVHANKIDVAVCKCKFVFDKKIKQKQQREHRRLNERYYNWNVVGTHKISHEMQIKMNPLLWNKIWRKDIIDRYNITFPTGHEHDDDAFWYMYSFAATNIKFIDKVLYNYCIRSGSIMDNYFMSKPKNREDRLKITLYLLYWLKRTGLIKGNLRQFYRIFDVQIKNMSVFFKKDEFIELLNEVKATTYEFKDKTFVVSRTGKFYMFLSRRKIRLNHYKYYFYLLMHKITRCSFYLGKKEKALDIIKGNIF